MPELSRLPGIVIGMFYREHGVARFHAMHGANEVSVQVETGRVHGQFPPRALKLVLEWTGLHKSELLEDRELAKQGQPLMEPTPLPRPPVGAGAARGDRSADLRIEETCRCGPDSIGGAITSLS